MTDEKEFELHFVNLTPHTLNILDEDGEEVLELEPDLHREPVRIETETKLDMKVNGGIPLFEKEFGEIKNLPKVEGGTLFVVGGLAKTAIDKHTDRTDFVGVGELVRDENGKPVGAKGFVK